MRPRMNRRTLLQDTTAAALLTGATAFGDDKPAPVKAGTKRQFKLGLVTYNMGMNWELPALIANCKAIGIASVEFRAEREHKHGVELGLSKAERKDVRNQCEDAGLVIWGMGSQCEYHSTDAAVVAKNIEDTKRYIELAGDLGAKGVKVRPNGFPKEVSEDKTLEQIGASLGEVARAGAGSGVEIWCEVHGSGTSHPPHMHKLMTIADHDNVGVVWNSNGTDIKDGSIVEYFKLLRPKIYSVHINELTSGYPYRDLFTRLRETGYDRYTMIEAQPLNSANDGENLRFARYYAALWDALSQV